MSWPFQATGVIGVRILHFKIGIEHHRCKPIENLYQPRCDDDDDDECVVMTRTILNHNQRGRKIQDHHLHERDDTILNPFSFATPTSAEFTTICVNLAHHRSNSPGLDVLPHRELAGDQEQS